MYFQLDESQVIEDLGDHHPVLGEGKKKVTDLSSKLILIYDLHEHHPIDVLNE